MYNASGKLINHAVMGFLLHTRSVILRFPVCFMSTEQQTQLIKDQVKRVFLCDVLRLHTARLHTLVSPAQGDWIAEAANFIEPSRDP